MAVNETCKIIVFQLFISQMVNSNKQRLHCSFTFVQLGRKVKGLFWVTANDGTLKSFKCLFHSNRKHSELFEEVSAGKLAVKTVQWTFWMELFCSKENKTLARQKQVNSTMNIGDNLPYKFSWADSVRSRGTGLGYIWVHNPICIHMTGWPYPKLQS